MNKMNGLLADIYDKRIVNKYTNLLPPNHQIFYYFEIDEDSCGFMFYIAEEMQYISKTKLNTALTVGYVSGFISIGKIKLESEDLSDIMEHINNKLDRTPYKKRVINALESNQLKLNPDEQQLLIEAQTRLIQEEISITFVSVNENYLGKGVGQFLMLLACNFAKTKYQIEKISLDDDSDNAWNLNRNMYVKLGLWYINEEPQPEMEGRIDIILENWSQFKKYYTDPSRNSYHGTPFEPYFI